MITINVRMMNSLENSEVQKQHKMKGLHFRTWNFVYCGISETRQYMLGNNILS